MKSGSLCCRGSKPADMAWPWRDDGGTSRAALLHLSPPAVALDQEAREVLAESVPAKGSSANLRHFK